MTISYKPKARVSLKSFAGTIPPDIPIVFWDSCSLLYILSSPIRDAYGDIGLYEDILQWIESGNVVSVTSDIVWKEFSDHYIELSSQAYADENKYKQNLTSYASHLPEPDKSNIINAVSGLKLVAHLSDMQNRIWNNTFVIKEEIMFNKKAHYRVLNKIAPSATKDQYKDSYIWITFAEMSMLLPPDRFKCFMTNNREDFCVSKKSASPQERISNDAKSVHGEFFCCLDTLRNILSTKIAP